MSRLTEAIEKYKELSKEKDCLARTFRGFRDYGNPKSTITSGAEENQHLSEEYGQLAEWLEELQSLRDKEEQGLLLELKVPLGTKIWYLSYEEDFDQGWWDIDCAIYSLSWIHYHENKEFYLTRSEAEEALAKMGGE